MWRGVCYVNRLVFLINEMVSFSTWLFVLVVEASCPNKRICSASSSEKLCRLEFINTETLRKSSTLTAA